MTAREEVLAAVRAALAPTTSARPARTPDPDAPTAGVETVEPARSRDPQELLALFAERVADYRAEVTRCAAADLGQLVVAILDGAREVVVPPGLGLEVPGARVDNGLSPAELDRIEAVVTRASVGIAETGTVVLDHGPGQGRRAVTLLPDLHICIVGEVQVVADVGDALARLDPERPQTWVSGPSATSDIELSRVEGVHGPRRLHVVLVRD